MAWAKYNKYPERYYPKQGYASDLTDKQWEIIEPLLRRRNNTGKHLVSHEKRMLINAVLYLNKTGCQWRMLPKDFPKYQSVASFYYGATASGLWDKINALLVQMSRVQEGRASRPTYALIDSQSSKTTGPADDRGYDGGKK